MQKALGSDSERYHQSELLTEMFHKMAEVSTHFSTFTYSLYGTQNATLQRLVQTQPHAAVSLTLHKPSQITINSQLSCLSHGTNASICIRQRHATEREQRYDAASKSEIWCCVSLEC